MTLVAKLMSFKWQRHSSRSTGVLLIIFSLVAMSEDSVHSNLSGYLFIDPWLVGSEVLFFFFNKVSFTVPSKSHTLIKKIKNLLYWCLHSFHWKTKHHNTQIKTSIPLSTESSEYCWEMILLFAVWLYSQWIEIADPAVMKQQGQRVQLRVYVPVIKAVCAARSWTGGGPRLIKSQHQHYHLLSLQGVPSGHHDHHQSFSTFMGERKTWTLSENGFEAP